VSDISYAFTEFFFRKLFPVKKIIIGLYSMVYQLFLCPILYFFCSVLRFSYRYNFFQPIVRYFRYKIFLIGPCKKKLVISNRIYSGIPQKTGNRSLPLSPLKKMFGSYLLSSSFGNQKKKLLRNVYIIAWRNYSQKIFLSPGFPVKNSRITLKKKF
jgi:hypothetical protein